MGLGCACRSSSVLWHRLSAARRMQCGAAAAISAALYSAKEQELLVPERPPWPPEKREPLRVVLVGVHSQRGGHDGLEKTAA